jgi:hypothetical protein
MNEQRFVVEWTDKSGVYQFRIMGKKYAEAYTNYLNSIGLGAECYAA